MNCKQERIWAGQPILDSETGCDEKKPNMLRARMWELSETAHVPKQDRRDLVEASRHCL